MNEEVLNQINNKLDEVLSLLKNPPLPMNLAPAGNFNRGKDGSVTAKLRVMTVPKMWTSGKGMFLDCKISGNADSDWYSVRLTTNVAQKVRQGYIPAKGDIITVRGTLEEKEDDKGIMRRSIFAFSVKPHAFNGDVDVAQEMNQDEDVPF